MKKNNWAKKAMKKEIINRLNGHVTYNERLAKDQIGLVADRLLGIVTDMPNNTYKITAEARDGMFGAEIRVVDWNGWKKFKVEKIWNC